MRRLLPILSWLIAIVFGWLTVGLAVHYIYDWLTKDHSAHRQLIIDYWPWLAISLTALLALAIWAYHDDKNIAWGRTRNSPQQSRPPPSPSTSRIPLKANRPTRRESDGKAECGGTAGPSLVSAGLAIRVTAPHARLPFPRGALGASLSCGCGRVPANRAYASTQGLLDAIRAVALRSVLTRPRAVSATRSARPTYSIYCGKCSPETRVKSVGVLETFQRFQ
jgi:hypothetical protein